jgi:ribonuclease HII
VVERILGIDEAGRGSVLGPLVVGGFLIDRARAEQLTTIGAKDSKALSPARRERVYEDLPSLGQCEAVVLSPREIDRYVVRRRLNELEARAFGALVSRLRPDEAHVDACDVDARRFAREVARWSRAPVRIVSRHHADRDDVVVGAASIVAKVRRDRALARLARAVGHDLGSGYPSDPRTIEFLRNYLATKTRVPTWVRASWATMQRVKLTRPARTLDGFSS